MTENHNVSNEETPQQIENVVLHLVNEIVNSTFPSGSSVTPQPSTNPDLVVHKTFPPTRCSRHERPSHLPSIHSSNSENKPTYEIYRSFGHFSESQSDVDVELNVSSTNSNAKDRSVPSSLPSVPPSYSTVIKQGRPSLDIRRDVRSMETQHLSAFSRIPPPSYAEIQGVWSREFSNASSEQILLGPDPIYIWCTHCATVVITVTQAQRSKFTHLTAAALCLFGCWPCAMLPYCMNSCKNIYHYCPDCNYLFGMYRPW